MRALIDFVRTHEGKPPSQRALAAIVELEPSGVAYHYDKLEADGFIKRPKSREARNITILLDENAKPFRPYEPRFHGTIAAGDASAPSAEAAYGVPIALAGEHIHLRQVVLDRDYPRRDARRGEIVLVEDRKATRGEWTVGGGVVLYHVRRV